MRKADVAWIAVGMAAAAAPSAGARAQQPAHSVQQDFDAATALSEQPGQDAAALAAWQALEGRTRAGSRSRAIVEVRKGRALYRTQRPQEASAAIRAGLSGLPATDATLREDRMMAQLVLAAIAVDTLDYAGAASAFRAARDEAASPGDKLGAELGLLQVQIFVDPAAAPATLARIDALAAGAKLSNEVRGRIEQRRAEWQLNAGDIAGAKASAIRAVAAQGGLTEQTRVGEVAARSDAAIALLLSGDRNEARRYMAMTGAGRLPKTRLSMTQQVHSPDCGGEAGLKPDDMAVVQFSIRADGATEMVAPVYATGGGKVALAFARAVRGWSWPTDQVGAIPPFFRYNARVELRCSTAFSRPAVSDSFDTALADWLAARGAPIVEADDRSDAAVLPERRAALAAAEAKAPGSLAMLAALVPVVENGVVPRDEQSALYRRGLAIAERNGAPPLARLALELPAVTMDIVDRWKKGAYARAVQALLDKAAYAEDPRARAAIRLVLVDDASAPRGSDRLVLLRQVADDRALPASDPLKIGALVRIASLEQAAGRPDAARTAFAATGLDAKQCAMLDATPKIVSMPGSDAFPQEAIMWGFEGWTQVQYDIAADGRATEQRTLLSYPPFIFSKAGTDFYRKARFAKTFRPDGGLGCGGSIGRIQFEMPGK